MYFFISRESFYPTSPADCLAKGAIGAHHLVVFFVAHVTGNDTLGGSPAVTLQSTENDAFAWVPPAALAAFRGGARSHGDGSSHSDKTSSSSSSSSSSRSSRSSRSSADVSEAASVVHVTEVFFPGASASGHHCTTSASARPAPAVAVRAMVAAQLARQYDSAAAGETAAGTAEAHRFALREFAARFVSRPHKARQGGRNHSKEREQPPS
jgi:hypothetical protein